MLENVILAVVGAVIGVIVATLWRDSGKKSSGETDLPLIQVLSFTPGVSNASSATVRINHADRPAQLWALVRDASTDPPGDPMNAGASQYGGGADDGYAVDPNATSQPWDYLLTDIADSSSGNNCELVVWAEPREYITDSTIPCPADS